MSYGTFLQSANMAAHDEPKAANSTVVSDFESRKDGDVPGEWTT